jgi:hypothetical protein
MLTGDIRSIITESIQSDEADYSIDSFEWINRIASGCLRVRYCMIILITGTGTCWYSFLLPASIRSFRGALDISLLTSAFCDSGCRLSSLGFHTAAPRRFQQGKFHQRFHHRPVELKETRRIGEFRDIFSRENAVSQPFFSDSTETLVEVHPNEIKLHLLSLKDHSWAQTFSKRISGGWQSRTILLHNSHDQA